MILRRTSRYIRAPIGKKFRFLLFSDLLQLEIYFLDKFGWYGLWIRHCLLKYILDGTPVLLALQVTFLFSFSLLIRPFFLYFRTAEPHSEPPSCRFSVS